MDGYCEFVNVKTSGQATLRKVKEIKTGSTYMMKIYHELTKSEFTECFYLKKLEPSPEFCQVHDFFFWNDDFGTRRWCIVMKYYENGSLLDRINSAKSSGTLTGKGAQADEIQITKWMLQLTHGVMEVHNRKWIHRDLKPDNLFLGKDDVLVIGDFGTANEGTTFSSLSGSAGYCAPEVLSGKKYNKSADMWSIGCILLDLLTLTTVQDLKEADCRLASIQHLPQWWNLARSLLDKDPKKRLDALALNKSLLSIEQNLSSSTSSSSSLHRPPHVFSEEEENEDREEKKEKKE